MKTNQQACQAIISYSRSCEENFDYNSVASACDLLMIAQSDIFDESTVNRQYEKLLEKNNEDKEKKKLLQESHDRIKKYLKFNIDFEKEFLVEFEEDNVPGLWKERYDDLILNKKENKENGKDKKKRGRKRRRLREPE